MDASLLIGVAREALLLVVLTSLPPVGASLLVGFVMSVVQATTQLQETTLTVVPKLCAAVLALVLAGPWIGAQLSRFATQLLLAVPQVAS
jgi:flagellar biosynthetic protein FliQ